MDALAEIFSFEGRANRAWYFWHVLLDDVAMVTMILVLVVIGAALESMLVMLPILGVLAAGIWAGLAITAKRLHDLERPGWHLLLLAIPIYNLYLGLVLLFKRGTIGPNAYGPDPLAAARTGGYLEA